MLWHNINPLSYTTWSHCMTNTFTWHFHFLFWVTVLSRVAWGLALPPRCCSIHMLYFLVWDWKVSLKGEKSGPWQPFWTAVIYKPFIVQVRCPSLSPSLPPPPGCTGHSFTPFLVPVLCIRKKGICSRLLSGLTLVPKKCFSFCSVLFLSFLPDWQHPQGTHIQICPFRFSNLMFFTKQLGSSSSSQLLLWWALEEAVRLERKERNRINVAKSKMAACSSKGGRDRQKLSCMQNHIPVESKMSNVR